MNRDASIEHALALIDALQAAKAIDSDQQNALKQAFNDGPSKPPEQIFTDSGLFDEGQVSALVKALELLEAGRISKEHIAIYVMSILQTGKPLSEALIGLEPFVKPEEPSILPAVMQVYKIHVVEELMKELEKRLEEFPQISWDEHVMALNVLEPRDFEIAKLGQSMIDQGEITKSQFAVALYDDLTNFCKFEESLVVRGWLPKSRT